MHFKKCLRSEIHTFCCCCFGGKNSCSETHIWSNSSSASTQTSSVSTQASSVSTQTSSASTQYLFGFPAPPQLYYIKPQIQKLWRQAKLTLMCSAKECPNVCQILTVAQDESRCSPVLYIWSGWCLSVWEGLLLSFSQYYTLSSHCFFYHYLGEVIRALKSFHFEDIAHIHCHFVAAVIFTILYTLSSHCFFYHFLGEAIRAWHWRLCTLRTLSISTVILPVSFNGCSAPCFVFMSVVVVVVVGGVVGISVTVWVLEMSIRGTCAIPSCFQWWIFLLQLPCCVVVIRTDYVQKNINSATSIYNNNNYWSLLYSTVLRSRADSLRSHVILHEWLAFHGAFFEYPPKWCAYSDGMAGATGNCGHLYIVYTIYGLIDLQLLEYPWEFSLSSLDDIGRGGEEVGRKSE